MQLTELGIRGPRILRNVTPAELYEEAIARGDGQIVSSGALAVRSGAKTGRSPSDKRIVRSSAGESDVWWGSVNIPLSRDSFLVNRQRAVDFFNRCERVFVVDGYAGWDPRHRIKTRVVCERPYHALFMHNMLIRPTPVELEQFGEPDFLIFNAGQAKADPATPGMTSTTSICLDLEERELVLLDTEYAGEMKKGVFTLMHYLMPRDGVLSLHCSANEGAEGDVSLFFGLSGTGKTTLSADPRRSLIGDDEHCWTEQGVYNIEGGCYAKCVGLSREKEPTIYDTIRFGAVLENVVFDPRTRVVDFNDTSLTENTRVAYPIEFIPHAKIPCLGGHPRHILLLACDAFGVLPPVSRLTSPQLMYHFVSGYTAKVAGTEMGIHEPKATFSACFGSAFLVRHPTCYAELLAEKMHRHAAEAWLINTGWTGGSYGTGQRINLAHTRAIIDAIHSGALAKAPMQEAPAFGLAVPTSCPGVPSQILVPRQTWSDPAAFDRTAEKLARMFHENFAQYADQASAATAAAGPWMGRPSASAV